MKTAEGVGEEYLRWAMRQHTGTEAVQWIAQALTAFAEERVREALEKSHFYCTPGDAWKQARAEALEEAAKICDEAIQREIEIGRETKGHGVFQAQAAIDAVSDVAEAIRALKGGTL